MATNNNNIPIIEEVATIETKSTFNEQVLQSQIVEKDNKINELNAIIKTLDARLKKKGLDTTPTNPTTPSDGAIQQQLTQLKTEKDKLESDILTLLGLEVNESNKKLIVSKVKELKDNQIDLPANWQEQYIKETDSEGKVTYTPKPLRPAGLPADWENQFTKTTDENGEVTYAPKEKETTTHKYLENKDYVSLVDSFISDEIKKWNIPYKSPPGYVHNHNFHSDLKSLVSWIKREKSIFDIKVGIKIHLAFFQHRNGETSIINFYFFPTTSLYCQIFSFGKENEEEVKAEITKAFGEKVDFKGYGKEIIENHPINPKTTFIFCVASIEKSFENKNTVFLNSEYSATDGWKRSYQTLSVLYDQKLKEIKQESGNN